MVGDRWAYYARAGWLERQRDPSTKPPPWGRSGDILNFSVSRNRTFRARESERKREREREREGKKFGEVFRQLGLSGPNPPYGGHQEEREAAHRRVEEHVVQLFVFSAFWVVSVGTEGWVRFILMYFSVIFSCAPQIKTNALSLYQLFGSASNRVSFEDDE